MYFKPDGTKMYVAGQIGDDVNEYTLSTAWDISTASYVQAFSFGAQETAPQAVTFKTDGTKMYVLGQSGNDVNEYNLSTAWDVSTASYSQNFSISSQEAAPTGLYFKSDGTKMYVVGQIGSDVNEYNLSTAWDVSTSTYNQNFSVLSQETNVRGLFFGKDGEKMYVVGSTGDSVYEYNTQAYTTSETWVNATTNDEFAAVAQAMSIGPNQMDKAQIDAVTDGSHFTLSTTLDLAIIPYLGSAGTSPTSDGVSINYDAAVLNKGAILGTDYDYDIPANDKVRITALAANNLKVRVV